MSILSLAIEAADTSEQAETAALIMSRCHASGLDAGAYRCVIGAALHLGLTAAVRGPAWRNDQEFMGALIDLECDLHTKLQDIHSKIAIVRAEWANTPHTSENTADLAILQAAMDTLIPARSRVIAALNRVIAAPDELTETYAACYRHVRAGKTLPYNGRFISGEAVVATNL